ncbi:MAG: TonB C-terminal domain-containing protein [Terriglobales bacterium]
MKGSQTQRTGTSSWVFSVGLHLVLGLLLFYSAWLGQYLPLGGKHPGTAAAGAIQATLVTSLPGGAIPIPSKVVEPTKNRLANDLPAPGISRPAPRPRAPRHSVALPSYNPIAVARKQAEIEARELAMADRTKKRDNRVAYGAGGRVSFPATSSAQGSGGGGGVSFGDANFGNLYTDWVNHLRDRLEYYWSLQPRDPVIPSGLKVTVIMTVHSSGVINSIHYVSRANSVEVNSMAYTAVQQMAAAEHFPLPAGYQHSSLVVTVTFEIH